VSPYHHGDLRRALIDATLELVGEKGPKGFTLAEAARRAGVSAAAPYRHFANKGDLLAAVGEQGFNDLHDALQEVGSVVSDPDARLLALCVAYVRWAARHPAYYQVMFGTDTKLPEHEDWMAAGERAFAILIEAIHDAQAAGRLMGDSPVTIAAPVWALLHGLATLHIGHDFEHVGIDESIEVLADRSLRALLSSPKLRPG
jgi:AcrR family transcriptional regulator